MNIEYCSRWKTNRFASVFTENSEKNAGFMNSNAVQFCFGTIAPKKQYELTTELVDTYSKYTIVQPNDIMLNGLNLNYDFVTQRVALVPTSGIITSAYISLRLRAGYNAKYYCYLLKSLDSRKVFNGMGTGIRLTLSYNLLKNMTLPTPLRAEQDQIVRYLDWQVSKINKLIAAKKKQIGLLIEYRLTTINAATTKGLNSDSIMKHSGITWIGLIPTDWNIVQLRRVTNYVKTGSTPSGASERFFNGTFKWYTPCDFGDGIYLSTASRMLSDEGQKEVKAFPEDSVMLIGIGGTMGKVAITKCVCSCNQQINVISCKEKLLPLYLSFFLKAIRKDIFATAKYTTLPILNQDETKSIRIPLCSIDEQQRIIDYLYTQCSKIDYAVDKIHEQIDALHELRTRIISDVVTGQIDVRNIEVPDFEMVEEIDDSVDEDDISEETEEQEE